MNKTNKHYKTYRMLAMVFVIILSLGLTITAMAHVWTDPVDYPPGSTVWIQGDNSNGAGYLEGETVQVDVVGPPDEYGNPYQAQCTVGVTKPDPDNKPDYLYWTCPVTLWNNSYAVGTYNYIALGLTSQVTESGFFTDGDASPELTSGNVIHPLDIIKAPTLV